MRKNLSRHRVLGKSATSREIADEIGHRSEYIVSKTMYFIEGRDHFPFLNIETEK